jgi:hypothetical protein
MYYEGSAVPPAAQETTGDECDRQSADDVSRV